MKLSPELEEICTCNNLDHTILNYYCPANGNEGSPCPVCGDYTLYSDAPKNAPDFLCRDCHDEKMSDDAEWRDQTLARKSSDFVEYADDDQFLIVLDVYTSCPNECGEKHIPILYEAIEGHDPMYILGCGKCGFLDDDWDPKYVYEKEDGDIIKYYRESSTFDVVPMHPSQRKFRGDGTFKAEEEKEIWVVELANRDGFRDAEFLGSQDDAQAYHDWVFEQDAGMTPWEITHIKDEQVLTLAKAKERFTQLYVLDDDEGGALQKPVIDYSTRWDGHGDPPEGYDAEELDYEDVENQAVMFDIINMIESNDLWNEIVFELIARGDAVRRPDGKIIFTDQAPQYDIIEDIAEYTSPQFEFNADGDIK